MDAMTGSDGSVAVEPGGEPAGPPRVSGRQLRELLADDLWLDELIDRAGEGGVRLTGEGGFLPELLADDLWLDELIDRAGEGGVRLTGEGGFLPELVKAVLERCWRRS